MRIDIDPEKVKQVFLELKDQSAFSESRELFDRGKLPVEMLQAMSLRPEILRAFAETGDGLYPGGLLERTLKEKVILKASQDNDCQFCAASHRDMMKMLGIPPAQIENLEADENLTSRERLALQYTGAMMQNSNRIKDELFSRLKENFSDAEIVELTMLVGFINMLNLFNNALGVTYRNEYEVE